MVRARSRVPVAAARTRSGSNRSRGSSSTIRPACKTSRRSLRPSSSGSSLVTSSTALPCSVSAVDEVVDLELGRDVDAPGRLVQQDHARLGQQGAAQEHFLLVAAGEAADRHLGPRRPDAQGLGRLAVEPHLLGHVEQSARVASRDRAERVRLNSTERSGTSPNRRRSSLTRANPRASDIRGVGIVMRLAQQPHRPRDPHAPGAVAVHEQFGSPRAHQPGDARRPRPRGPRR